MWSFGPSRRAQGYLPLIVVREMNGLWKTLRIEDSSLVRGEGLSSWRLRGKDCREVSSRGIARGCDPKDAGAK